MPSYPFFHDKNGKSLKDGYIYIGKPGLEPTQNEKAAYWDPAFTVPAAQPIRTINGRPSNNGSPASMYVDGDYSLKITDKQGKLVYSELNFTGRLDSQFVTGLSIDTVADLKSQHIRAGISVRTLGYYEVDDGSGTGYIILDPSDYPGAPDEQGDHTLANGNIARLAERTIANAKLFGAVGDDTVNDTVALQAACDYGIPVFVPSGTYRCEAALTLNGDFKGEGKSTLLKFYGDTIAQLVIKQVEGDIFDFAVDGANVTNCQIGVWLESDYEPEHEVCSGVTVTNILNTADSALGLARTRNSDDLAIRGNFFTEKCAVFNVSGLAIGKGIMYSFGNASRANITIRDCNVQDIFPVADSDAFHILTRDHNSIVDDYQAVIENCFAASSGPMKRCYKVQWHNAKVSNNIAIGDNVTIGYDTYAAGSIFDGNTYTETTGGLEAYNCFDALNTTISNATIVMKSSVSQAMRFGGASSVKLDNVTIDYQGLPTNIELGIIFALDSADLLITNLTLIAAQRAGSGIVQKGTSTVTMSNSTISGPEIGHYNSGGTVSCKMSNCTIADVVNGTQTRLITDFVYDISSCFIDASSIGIYNNSSGNANVVHVSDTTINTGNHAILGHADDVVDGCTITASAATGVGVSSKTGGRVSNNVITGFATGIQYTNSTNTIINSNTTIDCTAQFNKTGSVDFVFYENNDR